MLAGESEERLKGCHRSASPVETKHILVEIVLQVLLAHPVVRSRQPRFEVRKHPVHAGEELDSVLRMSLRLAPVIIALVGEGAVAAPAVGMHDTVGSHRLFEESDQRGGGQILDDTEPDATGSLAADLDGTDHDRLGTVAHPPTSAPDFDPAHIGLIDLYLAGDAVPLRSNHGSSQLLQESPRCFVAPETELPLQLHRRDAWRVGGDQVGGRKPIPKGQSRAMEHRARSNRDLVTAFPAFEDRS